MDPSIFPFLYLFSPSVIYFPFFFLTYVFSILLSFLSIYPSIHSSSHLSIYLLSIYFTFFPSCLSSLLHIDLFFCRHATCEMLVPWPGTDPRPWQWKCQVLTTRLPANSLFFLKTYLFPIYFSFFPSYLFSIHPVFFLFIPILAFYYF